MRHIYQYVVEYSSLETLDKITEQSELQIAILN